MSRRMADSPWSLPCQPALILMRGAAILKSLGTIVPWQQVPGMLFIAI